jgi:hypothetical protein
MNACPFSLDLYGGLGRCEGIIRDEGSHISLEFQNMDAVAGIIKSDVRIVKIPMKELVSVTITKGWLGTSWMGVKIVLQSAKMETLKDVPGMTQGKVELSVARKDRDAAEKFVAGLHEQPSE